ncbi:hypothetical protein NQ315_014860 [Exocentrus adspersus]|uniref:RNase H type-1 domain-containing protein n=1 Tax=Exocentrus adspersus TaxID=1586481 RepID=A0AAV8VKV7_9CUCU|nr:hypothetical protein NQ315_014860 [Exocentrus adspersus]
MKNIFSKEPLVQNILALLKWLKQLNKDITFIFTPSHVGILGNEKADTAARLAANSNMIDSGISVSEKDIITEINNIYIEKWQNKWNHNDTAYKRIHPIVSTHKPSTLNLSRKDQTIYTRLKTGHTRLTSMHLLRGERPPRCERCRTTLTIEHILIQCPTYRPHRIAAGIEGNLENILCNNMLTINKLLAFLRASGIYRCYVENMEVHVNFRYNRKCQTDAIILVRKIMSENP